MKWDVNGARLIEPETDAYMTATAANARMTSGVYGSDVATIAASNVFNYLGAPTLLPLLRWVHIRISIIVHCIGRY
jgi:hypothetical protein